MKQKLFLLMIVLCTVTHFTHAQSWTNWDWDDYAIGFSLPSGMQVTSSTDEEFLANNGRIFYSMYTRNCDNVTDDTAVDYLEEWTDANNINFDSGDLQEFDPTETNGFEGYFFEGTTPGGQPAVYAILFDPDYANCFFVSIEYRNTTRSQDIVMQILQSIVPN